MVCMILYVLKLIQFIVRDARKKRNTVVLPRENEKNPCSKFVGSISFSFSFSSRWYRSTRKGPYALRPVSQQSP